MTIVADDGRLGVRDAVSGNNCPHVVGYSKTAAELHSPSQAVAGPNLDIADIYFLVVAHGRALHAIRRAKGSNRFHFGVKVPVAGRRHVGDDE